MRVFAGAIPLALVTGWSVPGAIIAMGIVTLIYTYLGGLKAVVWADVIQLCVYVAGGIGALIIAMNLAGGPGAMLSHRGASRQAQGDQPGVRPHHDLHACSAACWAARCSRPRRTAPII